MEKNEYRGKLNELDILHGRKGMKRGMRGDRNNLNKEVNINKRIIVKSRKRERENKRRWYV